MSGPAVDDEGQVLTAEALAFVAELVRAHRGARDELLARRRNRREALSVAGGPDFLPETADIRADPDWQVAPAPPALLDRRVEITGPTEPKMAINALNSGAAVWLADLEDANTPHWRNVVTGQLTLWHAARGSLRHTQGDGREYELRTDGPVAVTVVRPRGWHLDERHLRVDDAPAPGALVDFGLHLFHNAQVLLAGGAGPYYYLPKLESHLEARLWEAVFVQAQEALGLPIGSIRATVLIETLPAAFEMEEILYELRRHASGLNAGRWDYLFSAIKTLRDAGPRFVLPDRAAVTMTAPFMRAYSELLVATCHRRGAFAMGGMAAFIPNRHDPAATERALAQVRADKEREARDGFDGSWVGHPDLVPVCREVFDATLGGAPNQLTRLRDDVTVTRADLLNVTATPGEVTEAGLRTNVSVAMQYIGAWLSGLGAVAIHDLMEDAATAEISRSQVWQWLRHGTVLATGEVVTIEMIEKVIAQEHAALTLAGATPHLEQARALFTRLALEEEFIDFLTLPALDLIE